MGDIMKSLHHGILMHHKAAGEPPEEIRLQLATKLRLKMEADCLRAITVGDPYYGKPDSFDGVPLTTATSGEETPPLTRELLRDILRQLKEREPACPFTAMMLRAGCDPNKGWALILPYHPDLANMELPPFVQVSPYVVEPMMFKAVSPIHGFRFGNLSEL